MREALVWTALLVALVGSLAVAHTMLSDPATGVRFVEPPVPHGAWRISWNPGTQPAALEQARQLRALRDVAAGTSGLVALLAILILTGLWRQRLRLLRAEHVVHWSVGARRAQLAARLAVQAAPGGGVAFLLALAGAAAIAVGLAATFPGTAEVPPPVAVALLTCTALAMVLLRSESRAGERAARSPETPFSRFVSGPASIAAVGFAVLTAVGLLTTHAPHQATEAGGDLLLAGLSLPAGPRPSPWLRDAGTAGLGLASAGTVRGTGVSSYVWVDCGRCSEGGLPLPLRTVRVEVHALAPDTFPHLGLGVLAGRDFDAELDVGPPSVAIVSRSLAGRHFERGEAVGRRLRVGDSEWLTVVGIVDDRIGEGGPAASWAVYLPLAQAEPTEVEALAPAAGAATLGAWLAEAPGGVRAREPRSTREVFVVHGWFGRLLLGLGVVAGGLVAIGVWFGARAEGEATAWEVALRRAVGARPRRLMLELGASFTRRLLAAVVVGTWLSLFLGAGLERAYGGVPQIDGAVWLRAAAAIGLPLLVGSWGPFARALRRPPARAL